MPYIHVEEGDKIGTGLTHSPTSNHDADDHTGYDDQNDEDDLDNYDDGDREKIQILFVPHESHGQAG